MRKKRARPTHCKHGHEFSEDNTWINPKTGHMNCRKCKYERNKKYAENNPQSIKSQNLAYRTNNPEKVQRDNLKRSLERAGFTPETRQEKLEEQDNKCAICGRELIGSTNTCMDHEHVEPPKPRGMLCKRHNAALGGFEDSVELLEAAINYLRKYGKV